jgi:ATP-binding protein involved in chromosome partitioning
MGEPSRDAILEALSGVIDPELQRPVTELDMVRDVEIEDGLVSLTIVLTIAGCPLRDSFQRQVDEALSAVPGVRGFSLSFGVMTPEERQKLTTKLRGGATGRDNVVRLPRDCRVIAVASGKGGVGKSTLTANRRRVLAARAAHRRLDADIYGPDPTSSASTQKPVAVDEMTVRPAGRPEPASIGFFSTATSP